MSATTPLVVAILHSNEDDIDYQLQSAAYGLEMQIDDEWNAELVLLATHDHLAAVTEETDVTGEDAAIVSAGVTNVPLSDDGTPDVSVIEDPHNNWLLLGDPRLNDADDVINKKLTAALNAGCRVIICVDSPTADRLATQLAGIDSIDGSQIVIAFVGPDATDANVATQVSQTVKELLASLGATGEARFIVAGEISDENAPTLVSHEGIDGLFLMDDKYSHFGTILEVLESLDD